MANLNEYMTLDEAVEFPGASKDSLRRSDRAGKLKARRHPITYYRLYLKKELDAILVGASKPEATRARERKRRVKR